MADRAGITVAEVTRSGSSLAALAFNRSECKKSRRIPAAFSHLLPAIVAGEYLAGLLDIGGSLC